MALLSHYTNRAGLEGIAKSKSLWATNFEALEDTSEYFFGWEALQRSALNSIMQALPEKLKRPDFDLEKLVSDTKAAVRKLHATTAGHGHLYVVSFARHKNEDHERRGIKMLWDRWNNEGYCLQFDEDDVRRLVQFEGSRTNYSILTLTPVKYGVDEASRDFRELYDQVSRKWRLDLLQATGESAYIPEFKGMWADSYLIQRVATFCGEHKDPYYEDEREMRIFAYPAERAESRFLVGIAFQKEIKKTAAGKRFIDLGEGWDSKLAVPRRILVGAKAQKDLSAVLAHYKTPPEIVYVNLPIA